MNKQEVIEKIEACKSPFISEDDTILNYGLDKALSIIKQLDEPEKPVVPKFVVDWVDNSREYSFDFYEWFDYENQPTKVYDWLNPENKRQAELNALALITLIVNGANAVEVEKEKLYTVEIPNLNDGELLTESEIKRDFEWAWQWAKPVEEEE